MVDLIVSVVKKGNHTEQSIGTRTLKQQETLRGNPTQPILLTNLEHLHLNGKFLQLLKR